MSTTAMPPADAVLGRHPDQLTLEQRRALAGCWAAFQIYSPATTPLRRIEAIGTTVGECLAMLKRRGLDPFQFEFSPLRPPY